MLSKVGESLMAVEDKTGRVSRGNHISMTPAEGKEWELISVYVEGEKKEE